MAILFLVLVDLFEILVGVDLQLAAGGLVAGDDAVGMQLQSADRPRMIHAAFDAVAQGARFVVAIDDQQDLLGVAHRADADGQRGLRHLVRVVVEETGVGDKRILGQRAHTRARGQRGEGLVERDMPVDAATAHEQVDAAVGCDLILVALALRLGIRCQTVEDIDILRRDVNMVKEILVHKVPVALVVLARQTDVLVHIEGDDVLKGHLARFIHLNEVAVYTERRGAGRQTQHEGAVALMVVDRVRDMLRRPGTHFLIVVLNNQFHSLSRSNCNLRGRC